MERWQGKVAIVTGASSGIGEAIAIAFVKHGLKVVGLARRAERIEKLAQKLSKESGKLYVVKTDMTKEEDILKAFKWTLDKLGRVDILVNNAGCYLPDALLLTGSTESWKEIININLLGLCIATREAAKIMMEKKIDGHIVHINSVAGHYETMASAIYGTTKFGVTQLTENLRKELIAAHSKIKVTSVSPGLVDTEILEKAGAKEALAVFPKLNPEDVAASVLHAIGTPPHVQIHEIIMRPVGEVL